MPIALSGKLVIPYGSASIRSDVLRRLSLSQMDDLERPAAPVAVVNEKAGQPLRLHSLVYPFTLPPVAQDLAHADTQLDFLERHLLRLCGDRAKIRRHFIGCYFEELRRHVRAHQDIFEQRTEPLAGLVELHHWCFSALLPLPRAYLMWAQPGANSDWQQSDFVSVDAAFWTGRHLIAVTIDDGTTLTGQRERAYDGLRQADVRLINVDKAALKNSHDTSLLAVLGDSFTSCFDGQSLPASPFRGRDIELPLAADGRQAQ